MNKETFDSKELIYTLYELCNYKKFKKKTPLPKFTLNEVLFIRDLIFLKPKDLVYFYVANNIVRRTEIGRMSMFGGSNLRRYIFLSNFFIYKGNATKAAIAAGYSKRSAKSQGHRLLRFIQNSSRGQIG